jgi:hypothetical protein
VFSGDGTSLSSASADDVIIEEEKESEYTMHNDMSVGVL